jgi:hypothetical protein
MTATNKANTSDEARDPRGDEDEAHAAMFMQAAGMMAMSFEEALEAMGSSS